MTGDDLARGVAYQLAGWILAAVVIACAIGFAIGRLLP